MDANYSRWKGGNTKAVIAGEILKGCHHQDFVHWKAVSNCHQLAQQYWGGYHKRKYDPRRSTKEMSLLLWIGWCYGRQGLVYSDCKWKWLPLFKWWRCRKEIIPPATPNFNAVDPLPLDPKKFRNTIKCICTGIFPRFDVQWKARLSCTSCNISSNIVFDILLKIHHHWRTISQLAMLAI